MKFLKGYKGILWMLAGIVLLPLPATTTPWQVANALAFGGTDGYVTFGSTSKLGLSTFTLETWFRRDAAGQPAFTGNGGLNAIPLITKGRGEDDGSNVDMNYFLGIDSATGVLAADFEDKVSGGNHPILGVTPLRFNTWYHAAVTYSGSKWQLYLNGILEAELTVGQTPRNDSIQHAAMGAALDSTGAPQGAFAGAMDEVRIWNYARPAQQIRDGLRQQISAVTSAAAFGLVACWELNEGNGTLISNSVSQGPMGSLVGANWIWVEGVKFTTNSAPTVPAVVAPSNGATGISTAPELKVAVADANADNLVVTWYGKIASAQGADFTLVALPDTQYYVAKLNGGTPQMFTSQTQWIVNNRVARNIAYVAHLGDCVEHGNSASIEWDRANTSLKLLESIAGLSDGLPYGLAVGNHDQTPDGNPDGTSTALYNQYFGTSRFRARAYYGGRYSSNHDNHYQLFSASGLDFIVIYLEYNEAAPAAILNWADGLLKSYSDRRAIVVSHSVLDGNAQFSTQGQAIYNTLKNNPNLFLLLGGHVTAEKQRQDIFNGKTVYSLLSDYQLLEKGGNGWMRILEFSPANNQLRVKTYSPVLNAFQTDADSQFTLSYDMQGSGFTALKTNPNVAAGTTATTKWSGLQPNTEYEWYVTVSDGLNTVASPHWRFRTGAN